MLVYSLELALDEFSQMSIHVPVFQSLLTLPMLRLLSFKAQERKDF